MLAVTALVAMQRVDDVLLVLPDNLRHRVLRVGVGVARYAVAAGAGVDQFLAGGLVACGLHTHAGHTGCRDSDAEQLQSSHCITLVGATICREESPQY